MQVSRRGHEAERGEGLPGFPRQARQEQAEGDQGQPVRRPARQERGGNRRKDKDDGTAVLRIVGGVTVI